jgi:hypothetical protein
MRSRHRPLDIHVVKLGCVSGLLLDLLGYFSAGEDSVTLEGAEDSIEATLLDHVTAFQPLNHLPVGVRVFEVHIERGRIGDASPGQTSFTAPEFHAALVIRVQNPHGHPPQCPGWSIN